MRKKSSQKSICSFFFSIFAASIKIYLMASNKTNILIDLAYIHFKPTSAISTQLYAGRLVQGFEAGSVFHPVVLVTRGMEDYIDELAGFETDKLVIECNAKKTVSVKLDRLFGVIPFEKELERRQIKVVLNNEFRPHSYLYPKKYRQHIIVHDLIAARKPLYKMEFYYPLMLRWAMKRVPYVISISETTRKDLRAWCGRDSDVVYNSIPFDFKIQEQPVSELLGRRYILDVNRFDYYKNTETLIKAFFLLKDRLPQHILYLKGYLKGEYVNGLQAMTDQMGIHDRVVFDTSYRNEGEMRWLYTHADLFVTPSLQEGFGYTPIEAAVLKTPVLISNINTLLEVTQGKLKSFDPHHTEQLAAMMLQMLNNPPTAEELSAIADFYLKEYSLEKQIERLTSLILSHL